MQQPHFPTTPFKVILHFLKPYKLHLLGLFLISLLWAIDVSLRPYLIKKMLDILAITSLEENLFYALGPLVIFYLSLGFFMNFIYRFNDYLTLKFLPVFNKNIVIRMLEYTQLHSHTYFQNHFGGSIVTRISEMGNAAQALIDVIIDSFIPHTVALFVACVTLASVYPYLAGVLLLWTGLFLLVSYHLSRKSYILSQQLSETHITLIGRMIDGIVNMLTVRLFARHNYELRYIESSANNKVEKNQELRWSNLKRNAIMDSMSNILIAILLGYLIYARQKDLVTIGDFALVLMLSLSIIDTIWNSSRRFVNFIEDLGRFSQALTLIVRPHEIADVPEARRLQITQGTIQFDNVSFYYKNITPLFQNFSLIIPGRQKVGVVGYSGSGKTTFVNLIVRLYEVSSGQIRIDNQNITSVTQDSLHEAINFIPQEPSLFHRSVFENIRYGNPQATYEEVVEAAVKAHANDFIQQLPLGYETLVGEKGVKLSGGQRQRIAIARSILKNSSILLLDEATSALDSITEHYIQESLNLLMQDKTVIVIAHRLSTLLKMDRILVFKEGQIIEDGPHEALIRQNGLYNQLWAMQANGFLPQKEYLSA
ncbi:MAG: ABC transporter ATP-binding protein [Alphaproteobacteria bacterium]|nr:ABC transporter ATP-binding protein [Alphaproteobacteria bacterium]